MPSNALKIDPCDSSKRYVERDDNGTRRLYDKDEQSFVLDADVDVDVTWFFAFETLPESCSAYIAHRAARVFQTTSVGSEILYSFTKEREQELLVELERDQLEVGDHNILDGTVETSFIARRQAGYRNRNF